MAAIDIKDTALTVGRLGALRLGAGRIGFVPKETDDPDTPGIEGFHYAWADEGHQDDYPSTSWTEVKA